MIFVVDNNIFSRSFKNLNFSVFEDMIYKPWSNMIFEEKIVSVDEVYRELQKRWDDKSNEGKWLKRHKTCFQNTTNKEGFIIADIFKNKKYQEGVKEKSIRDGNPEADAFIIAKAKVLGGIVVTAESDEKPNSEKIPNISVSQGVPYMSIDDFYMILKNSSDGKPLFNNAYGNIELGVKLPLLEIENKLVSKNKK